MHIKSCVLILSLLQALNVYAGVQSQMDSIFNEMTNVTEPGIYQTQSRGVISGGRIISKSKIFDENLIDFNPPSIKAGCGGIDIYGGSFSFIREDKIVELLRAVASNAKGYAFQLALAAYFPEGAAWMEVFQKKLQSLNESLGNSCQLAKGIVNGTKDAWNGKMGSDNALAATFEEGLFTDWSEAKSAGKTAEEELKANSSDKWKKLHGNVLWKAFKESNAESWLSGGDTDFLNIVLSLTGVIVVSDIKDADRITHEADGDKVTATEKGQNNRTIMHKLTFEELFEGGTGLTVFDCAVGDDICEDVPTTTTSLKSLATTLEEEFEKIEDKYRGNIAFTNTQKNLLSSLPAGMGGMINTLSALDNRLAGDFMQKNAARIAAYYTYETVIQYLDFAEAAMNNSEDKQAEKVMVQIDDARKRIRNGFYDVIKKTGKISEMTDDYYKTLRAAKKPPVLRF